MNRQKVGRFSIPRYWLEFEEDLVRRIMGSCIIVRAEAMEISETINYVASSPLFDEIEEHSPVPEYLIEVTTEKGGGKTWGFRRQGGEKGEGTPGNKD